MKARKQGRGVPRLVLCLLPAVLALPAVRAVAAPAARAAAPPSARASARASARTAAPPRQHLLYLSAGAPYGDPGARASFKAVCGDTVRRDTLYLSFEPESDDTGFVAFQGELDIYAQPGDTLSDFWALERGGANHGGLAVQFGPDETFPRPQPWGVPGIGSIDYDRTPLSARLRFVFAVPITHPSPVKAGTRYVLGRIILRARHPDLAGCERPNCLEWHAASLGYKGRPMVAVTGGGSRWLSRGGARLECRERIPAWRPRGAGAGTVAPAPATPH